MKTVSTRKAAHLPVLLLLVSVGEAGACGRTALGTFSRADDPPSTNPPDTWQTACQAGTCQQYRCKGDLTFKPLAVAPTGGASSSAYHPALGDFDKDGTLDLAGMPDEKGAMSLLFGAGDGGFPVRRVLDPAAIGGWTALAADVDGDGTLDLASIINGQSAVTVRRGSGDRNAPFGETSSYLTSKIPSSLLLADFDGDGRLDLVAGERGLLEQWQGRSGGRFEHSATIESKDADVPGPYSLLATDWTRDGILDLVHGPGNVHFRPGRGDGSFDPEVTCALELGCIGDLNGDDRLDLATGTGLLLGMDGCQASAIVPLPDGSRRAAALADFSGDDKLDIVSDTNAGVVIEVGDGKGGFDHAVTLPGINDLAASGSEFLVGDLNRDGKLDLVLARSSGWRVFLNTCP